MHTYAVFANSFFTKKPWWMPTKLYRAVCFRANPRPIEYMLTLLQERFPDAILLTPDQIPQEAMHIVLLYPDSIGMGWLLTELRCMQKSRSCIVINGRKRQFNLNLITWIKLLVKRGLEKTFLPELFFAPILLLVGGLLACKDQFLGCANDRSN